LLRLVKGLRGPGAYRPSFAAERLIPAGNNALSWLAYWLDFADRNSHFARAWAAI
jgi:hypothetical protein